jgi:hypothetical protein
MSAETKHEAVEVVVRRMQLLYETAGEEPERSWAELPESVREEWRGDSRSVLQAAAPAIRKQEQEQVLSEVEAIFACQPERVFTGREAASFGKRELAAFFDREGDDA